MKSQKGPKSQSTKPPTACFPHEPDLQRQILYDLKDMFNLRKIVHNQVYKLRR